MTTLESSREAVARARRFLEDHPSVTDVSICVPDGATHLRGKTVSTGEFLRGVETGFAMPNFFLVTDVGNEIMPDDPVSSLETGFANAELHPRLDTLQALPWDATRAIVLGTPADPSGVQIPVASETILGKAVERLAALGLEAQVATELEFYLFHGSYTEAHRQGHRALRPLYHRHGDHDILVYEGYHEYLRSLGDAMQGLGYPASAAHGEGGVGQVEMNFPHGDPLRVADAHTYFKYAAKTLGMRTGLAPSFMAKIDPAQAGSSCHIHCSLWSPDGSSVFAGDAGDGLSATARSFIAGLLRFAPDLTVLYAPYANSYSRLKDGSWAPTRLGWAVDNRTVLARVLGRGAARRIEFRLAGADANPYHALAALLHSGAAGVEQGLELEPALSGNGYADREARSLPTTLLDALGRFEASDFARDALGSTVYDHFQARAKREVELKLDAVSDWDLNRLFENA